MRVSFVSRAATLIVLLVCTACVTRVSRGQSAAPSDQQVDAGTHQSGTYSGVQDSVSLASGNLSLCIPIVSLKGRNNLDVDIPLCYNSEFMELGPYNSGVSVSSTVAVFPWTWNASTPAMGAGWSLTGRPIVYGAAQNTGSGFPVAFMGDGSKHAFTPCKGPLCGPDMSLADMFELNGVLYLKNGTQVTQQDQQHTQVMDTNGNKITYTPSGVTDTIGRAVSVVTTQANGLSPETFVFSYPDPSGASPTVSVTIQLAPITFNCASTIGFGNSSNAAYTEPLPSAVILPNGRSYTFQYNTCGLLSKISYPSGGYTRYDYSVQNFTMANPAAVGGYTSVPENEIAHKYVCSAAVGPTASCTGAEETTTYTPVVSAPNGAPANNSQMTVVDPVGNKQVYTFQQANPSGIYGVQGVETSRTYYDASNNFLRSVQTQYSPSCRGASPVPSFPTSRTTQLDNGMVSQTLWTYDCYTPAANDTVLTQQQDFDFGPGATGALLKTTNFTWLHRDNAAIYGRPTNSGGANILDRKSSEMVYDGAGNLIAQTKYQYDYGTPSSTPTGNLTQVSRWRSTDGVWLNTANVYDRYGNVTQTQDPVGNSTHFSYADNYSDGVNRSSNAFLTQTTLANGQTTQAQYSFGGGLPVAACGANFSGTCAAGLTSAADYSSSTYDVLSRKTAVKTGDGGSSTVCYSDIAGGSCANAGFSLSTVTKEIINASETKVATSVMDGLGRVVQKQLNSDPNCSGGSINVDTTYDLDERVSTQSNPYCSTNTNAPTAGTTAFTYDGLNRKTKITNPDSSSSTNTYTGRALLTSDEGRGSGSGSVQRVSQKDALGRLVSVCELTGAKVSGPLNTPSACGLDVAGTGFLTQYSFDPLGNMTAAVQGGIRRSFIYDSLSELKSALNPESGTTTYTYDNDGNLATKKTATAITTTYGYDTLNRLISKTYSDNATPSACFAYDLGSYGKGRLSTEWTQAGACPAAAPTSGAATLRQFNYDLMGHLTSDQQCPTPGICGSSFNTVSYGYDLAGDATSSTNGLTGSAAMSFTSFFDTAGQLASMNGPSVAGATQQVNLFQAQTYTPAGAIGDATIGSGITLHRDYNNRLMPTDETDTVRTTPGTAIAQLTGGDQLWAYSMGSITFAGSEQSTTSNGQTTYDSGNFVVSVGSSTAQIAYSQNDTPQTLAAKVATQFSCSSGPVQALAAGAVATFESCHAGLSNSYAINAYADGHTSGFSQYSFSVASSAPAMQPVATASTGGVTPIGNIYFAGGESGSQGGSYEVFVWNGPSPSGAPVKSISASWSNGTTAAAMASAFASSFGACGGSAVVGATANGSVVALTACSGGVYSQTVQLNGFGPGGQADVIVATMPVVPSGIYDSGTVALAINGTQVASAPYSSATLSPAAVASALIAANGGSSPVTLSANGSSLTVSAKNASNDSASYALSFATSNSSLFPQQSFAATAGTGTLAGSQNAPLYNWKVSSYAPNLDVLSMTDSVLGTWSYSYDDLNRLTSGNASAGTFSGLNLGWAYDRYGNRWQQNASGTGSASVTQPQLSFTGNNNRIDGWSYDADGNLLNDSNNAYTYDAENRIATVNGKPAYIYDATGARVAKLTTSGTLSAIYILGPGGQQITELNGTGAWQHSNVYTAGGKLLATYTAATNVYHYNLTDWLGTKRMQTSASGNQEETCTSLPFGDGLACTGTADATEQHFTGKDRDAESGLDYFGARYLSSTLGRFMTPDWAAKPADVPYAHFGNPQSLNLYAYAYNNPNTGVDADGHEQSAVPTAGTGAPGSPSGYHQDFSGMGGQPSGIVDESGNMTEAPHPSGAETANQDDDDGNEGSSGKIGTVVNLDMHHIIGAVPPKPTSNKTPADCTSEVKNAGAEDFKAARTMPKARSMVGRGLIAGVLGKVLTGSNPLSALTAAAGSFADNIGGAIVGYAKYATAYNTCMADALGDSSWTMDPLIGH